MLARLRAASQETEGRRIIRFAASDSTEPREHLDAEVISKGEEGEILLKFALAGEALDTAIERIGQMPLPPLYREPAAGRP